MKENAKGNAKEKIRVLLAGKNKVVQDDFFYNMSEVLECQSTSTRSEDINCHVKYFEPDVYLYCLLNEPDEVQERILEVFEKLGKLDVICGIVGDHDKCEELLGKAKTDPKLILERPLNAVMIMRQIEKVIREEKEKRLGAGAAKEGLCEDKETESPEKKTDEKAEEKTDEKSSRRHVTVIDDDFRMLRVLKDYLHGDYDVATAVNGKTALRFLEKKHTDVILLDYVMPEEDGPELYGKIRAIPAHANTPIIFLTGMSEREKIRKVMELRPQGYLLKPIDRERLLNAIEGVLG